MRKLTVVLTALVVTAGIAPIAAAQETGSRQTATLKFTKKQPGVSTGFVFKVDYVNPDDPAAKPAAVTEVVETLAPGARFDTSAPALCTASDPALMLQGPPACPAGSAVAEGQLRLDTGLPAPARFLDVGVDFFNNTDEFIFLTQPTALDSPRVVVRAAVGERSLTSSAPFLPGTPPDGAAIDAVTARAWPVDRIVDGEMRSYLTTPPRCPRRGYWLNEATFTYFDDVTQTVATRSPCRRPNKKR